MTKTFADPMRKRDREREVELTYTIRIKSYGHPSKIRREVGHRLAKMIGLVFHDWEVWEGEDTQFTWSVEDHNGGDPFIDEIADDRVMVAIDS